MQKKRMWGAAVLLLFTAAVVGASSLGPAERKNVPPAENAAEAPAVTVLELSAAPPAESGASAGNMLPGLEISALETNMPAADWAAFEAYLPVLRGEQTFRWVAGPHDGYECDWEPFDADMTAVRDKLWDGYGKELPETLTLDRLAVQDIDGDGTAELVLLFQDGAYNYLVLHREGEDVYGTSLYVRWFESLQTSGVYIGAGGAGYSTYYRMAFQNGRFEQRELGRSIDGAYTCRRELDGREVTKEDFDAWLAENMAGDVIWYAPDGGVLPGSM